jgi:hypothetical protein
MPTTDSRTDSARMIEPRRGSGDPAAVDLGRRRWRRTAALDEEVERRLELVMVRLALREIVDVSSSHVL